MNTANLQLEGLLMAIAALTQALRDRGLLSQEEIDGALEGAARIARADHLRPECVSASNVEAVLFPIRFLRIANERAAEEMPPAFSELAAQVGRKKWEVVR